MVPNIHSSGLDNRGQCGDDALGGSPARGPVTTAITRTIVVHIAVSASFPGLKDAEMGLWDDVDSSMSTPDSIVEGLGRSDVT